jgi:hypothetical protein
VPTEPLPVPIVGAALELEAGWLAVGEAPADVELEPGFCELPPHAASRTETPTAAGMRSLLNESIA